MRNRRGGLAAWMIVFHGSHFSLETGKDGPVPTVKHWSREILIGFEAHRLGQHPWSRWHWAGGRAKIAPIGLILIYQLTVNEQIELKTLELTHHASRLDCGGKKQGEGTLSGTWAICVSLSVTSGPTNMRGALPSFVVERSEINFRETTSSCKSIRGADATRAQGGRVNVTSYGHVESCVTVRDWSRSN